MDGEEYVSLENLRRPASKQDLQSSIDSLNQSINSLVGLFKEAAESLKMEEKEADIVAQKIDPIMEKLDMIIDQNKKIAKGIVAVADMMDERLPKIRGPERPVPQPSAPSMQMMGPPQSAMSPQGGMRPMPLPPRPLPR
jgi:hypothetical protein